MYQVNPMQIIQMIKNGQNPQQLLMSIMKSSFKGTPIGDNLLSLMENNNTPEIEKVVKNIFQQRGIDFDKEFNAFRQTLGLK